MFERSKELFEAELRQLKIGDKLTVRGSLSALRDELRELNTPQDELERRRLGGRLAGVKKRWRALLVAELTRELLAGQRPGRERVREWQQETFGASLSSREMSAYSDSARAGGGRGEKVATDSDSARVAQQIFREYVARLDEMWRAC